MITELSDLKMADFVRMVNGNYKVLLKKGEIVNPKKIADAVRKLSYDFQMIADPTGIAGMVTSRGEMIRANCEMMLYLICDATYALGEVDTLKAILKEAGTNASEMNDDQIKRHILSELAVIRRRCHRLESDMAGTEPKDDDGKIGFSAITASMMSYFKFQIDISVMTADIYAHLIKQMKAEIREKTRILKRKG